MSMKKEEIIEIIKTCQWAITVFGIWCLLFIFGVMWLSFSSKKDLLADIAISKYQDLDSKYQDLEKRFINHGHERHQNDRVVYP